ncbi:hypothetical protein pb186bvf_006857 [Paramecium bursaria]
MDKSPTTASTSLSDEQAYQQHLSDEVFVKNEHRYTISSNKVVQKLPLQNKEGDLLKKSPKLLVGWQKRHVRLLNGKLLYYKGQTFKGCIDFHIIQLQVTCTKKDQEIIEIQLHLLQAKKVFQFKSCDNTPLNDWFEVIQQNIQETSRYAKLDIKNIKEVWRHDRISHEYFRKEADTGDLLLFRGNSTLSQIQRAITGGNYDHVAILLRYNNGELFIFESLGLTGVSLLSWDKFLHYQWHKLYQELVFRHLDIERTEELIESLENFIKVSIGKRYKISPGKIFKRFSNSQEDITTYEKSDKTFFCSELVAAAYKTMKLIDNEKSAASYWPNSFSDHEKLTLQKGQLTNEQLIDFTL